MKGKLLLLLLSMLIISTTASASSEKLLMSGQHLVWDTEIGSHFVTWYENSGNGLNVYDLNTRNFIDESFTNDLSMPVYGPVEVYNNYVVWNGGGNILLYDSTTNTQTQIDTYGDNPVVYGSKIVYNKYDNNGNSYIGVYDITKKTRYTFPSQGMQISDMYGSKVVGTIYNSNNGRTDVYIADIGNQQMTAISTSGQVVSSQALNRPQIYGNVVVWSESTAGESNVYMRDISTHTTTKISTDKHSSDPKIYGNRIVYDSGYTSNGKQVSNVYMYDKSTKKTTQITTSGTARFPSIYGDNIIYMDYKNADTTYWEGGGVYLYSLTATPTVVKPVAAFTASKTSSSIHPVTITFTYTGTGTTPITCKWTFGDGTSASTTAKTISHKYSGKGIYTVGVTATNSAGSNSISKKNYITVK